MKISLSSFVYLNYTLEEAIRRTAEAGYDGIDVWGGRPHAYRRDLGAEDVARLCRLLRDHNLEVASFIPAQFRYPTCLCSNNETIRRDSVAYICDSVETAASLGAPLVSVCPGHTVYGQEPADAWGRLGDSLAQICAFAAARGLRVAIEPADAYETDLIQTTAEAMRMAGELGLDNLGVLLDNGHAYVVGEPVVEAVRALGSRLFHVHVDDNMGVRDQHLVPGRGTFEFDPLLAALRESGYDGFLCAELSWDYTLEPDQAATETARYLRRWVR